MKLVFCGASNVLNFGLESDQVGCSDQVAKHFNTPLTKIAVNGGSNDFVIRSVKEHVENNHPTLLIIGLQTWEREEWLYEGQYYQINSTGSDNLPPALQQRYKQWILDQPSDPKYLGYMWHDRVWQLHTDLKQKNIQHVFYNEMYPFVVPSPLDWGSSFIGPYDRDLTYYWHMHGKGYQHDDFYHYGIDGHTAWAKILIDHIEKHQLI